MQETIIMTNLTHHFSKHAAVVIVILTFYAGINTALSQSYNIREQWYLGPQLSVVSFFGDLSVHDFNPARKLSEESDIGVGLQIGKSLSKLLDLRFTYNYGNMKGSNPEMDMYFSNKFNEISFDLTFSLSRIIWPVAASGFNFTLNAGLGLIQYRSIKYKLSDDTYLSSEGYNSLKEPEGDASLNMVFPVGAGLSYTINSHWSLTSNFAFRLHNKDLLDSQVGATEIDDRYSIASFGFIYVFNPARTVNLRYRGSMDCSEDFR